MSAGLHVGTSLGFVGRDARLDPPRRRPGDRDSTFGTLYLESACG